MRMATLSSENLGSPSADDSVIDRKQLLERCLGNREFAERCLTRFSQRLEADFEQLQQSVKAGESQEVARIAHLIKGSAATVAATALSQQAGLLEDAMRQCPHGETGIESLTKKLECEVSRFLETVSPDEASY